MATLEEIGRALKNAHAAGDTAAAQKLAAAYKAEQAKGSQPAMQMQSNAGMVEQGTISRDEYMRTRGGVGFNGQPLAPQDYGTAPAAPPMTFVDEGTLGLQKGMRKGDIERFDPASLDRPMDTGARTKMPRSQSVALGVVDMGYPIARQLGNLAIDTADAVPGVNLEGVKLPSAEGNLRPALTQSLKDNPNTTRVGQGIALTAGGGAQLWTKGMAMAPKLVAPAVAARFAGQTVGARLGRYLGRGVAMSGLGVADYFGYNALAESQNRTREQGLDAPTAGERLQFAAGEVFTPGGAIAAGIPIVGSALGRGIRGAVAAGSNKLATGFATLSPVAGQAPRQVNVSDLFTPRDVQARVANLSPQLTTMTRTDAERAIDMLLKRGFDPDEAEKMVKFLDYAGKSEVPEMLFQLMPDLRKVDQLTVALGTVGGDAQKALGDALGKQGRESPAILRNALRKAMGISGKDYYGMAKGLRADQLSKPKAGYEAAYAKEVTDDTWQNQILPALQTSPSARKAVSEAAEYAADQGELGVAGQLAKLADALKRQGARPAKVSTQSLDYIDRMLGDMAQGIKQGSGRKELARGPISAQSRIRGDANSGLDVETGLGDPRRLSGELKTAQEAMVFGRSAYRDGTDIETLLEEFAEDIAKRGVDGAESEVINGALLMGWLRGAEDDIAKATNPQSVIRRMYGSERQRDKLLAMMPELADDAGAGFKGSNTKDVRALIGGKREDGRQMEGMIDRLRRLSGDYNRIIGNSQSAQRLSAVAEQGELSQKLNMALDALLSPAKAAVNVTKAGINYATRPGIYEPGVNRELGRLLTASGKKQLLSVIDEIRQRQLARSGRSPFSGPLAGGGTAASGFAPALRTDLGNAGAGAFSGGILPMPSTGDPQEDLRNRLGAILGGAAVGYGGRRTAYAFAPGVRSQGLGAPKTPQQVLPPDYGYVNTKIGNASLEATLIEDSLTIHRLKVPEGARGQGAASKALDKVLREADDRGLTTTLRAEPVGSGGMTQSQLEAFYARRGFVSDGGDNMVRPPQARSQGLGNLGGGLGVQGVRAGRGKGKLASGDGAGSDVRGSAGAVSPAPGPIRSAGFGVDFRSLSRQPSTAGGNPLEALAEPGRRIAGMLRSIDRGLRPATDPRVIQPTIAAGNMKRPKTGQAALEAMRNPEATIPAMSNAARRAEDASTFEFMRQNQISSAGQNNAQAIQSYRNNLQSRADAAPNANRLAETAAVEIKQAQQQAQKLHGDLVDAIIADNPQAQRMAAESLAGVKMQIEMMKRNAPKKQRENLDRVISIIDVAVAEGMKARQQPGYVARTLAGPGLKKLRRDGETLALLTDPARAKDAYRIANEVKPLGSWEKTGQATALGATVGAGALVYDQTKKAEARKQEDYYASRDAWDVKNKHVDNYAPKKLEDVQSFLNAVVPPEEDERDLVIDGRWGENTSRRIKRYQKMRGLTVNGRLTWETITDLEAEMNAVQR
jgi:GNAT superfamily N-acetyltransferase